MNKVKEFIEKHGYSYKSYIIALIVFPPTCFVIAWKISDINLFIRITLSVVAVVIPISVMFLGGTAVSKLLN